AVTDRPYAAGRPPRPAPTVAWRSHRLDVPVQRSRVVGDDAAQELEPGAAGDGDRGGVGRVGAQHDLLGAAGGGHVAAAEDDRTGGQAAAAPRLVDGIAELDLVGAQVGRLGA